MLNLPKSTEFNKRIPKEKFYSIGSLSKKDKTTFVNDVDKIIWSNKISDQTTNISSGKEIYEIQVITVVLKRKDFDISVINIIRKLIPYHILFNIEYEGMAKLAVYHTKLIQSEWQSVDDLNIEIKGLNLDKVWENIIVQVGGIQINQGNTLDEQIAEDERKEKLQKEIARLEAAARKEKQPKKKFEIVYKIKELKAKL